MVMPGREDGGGEQTGGHLVAIARFYDISEALVAKSAIEHFGIPVHLANLHHAGMNWHLLPALQGVVVEVPDAASETAQKIIKYTEREVEAETMAGAFWKRPILNICVFLVLAVALFIYVPFWARNRGWIEEPAVTKKMH